MTTQEILEAARAARSALGLSSGEVRRAALLGMAEALCSPARQQAILDANAADLEAARGHISEVMLDRLALTPERISAMAKGIREVADLPDPVGKVLRRVERPNGLVIEKTAVPMGVIAIIYESRPKDVYKRQDDHFIRYNANKGVLLACGGFPGNPYMMEQLDPLGTSVTTACSYSPSDKGYGIRAAMWAGANLDKEAAPMLFDRGIVAPGVDGGYVDSDTAFGGKAFPGTIRQYNPGTQPFLKVNRNGERFANESSPYNDIVYAAAHQPGRVYAQICDANILEDAKRFHTIGCSAQTRNGGEKYIQGKMDEAIEAGALFKCDTLDELADKMGFTGAAKDTFLATVERYNELYDKQNDEDFGKPAYRLSAIRTAPFYGCWLGASLLTTEQGIAINEKGQALDNDNKPMPGLYITGDMSGSFFANNYPCLMAGVAMGRTLTFAMKAVKQMAGLE